MSLGPLELAMLAAIALLFFGPAKLPQLGKSIGEAIRGFKGAMNDMNEEINRPETDKKKTAPASKQDAANQPVVENPVDESTEEPAEKHSESKKKEKDPAR